MRYIATLLLFVSFSSFADPSTVYNQLLNTKSKPTITKSGCSSAFYGVEWILYSDGYVEKIRNSPNCTIQLPPLAGTLVNSGCSADYPGVEWFVYNDGCLCLLGTSKNFIGVQKELLSQGQETIWGQKTQQLSHLLIIC